MAGKEDVHSVNLPMHSPVDACLFGGFYRQQTCDSLVKTMLLALFLGLFLPEILGGHWVCWVSVRLLLGQSP